MKYLLQSFLKVGESSVVGASRINVTKVTSICTGVTHEFKVSMKYELCCITHQASKVARSSPHATRVVLRGTCQKLSTWLLTKTIRPHLVGEVWELSGYQFLEYLCGYFTAKHGCPRSIL